MQTVFYSSRKSPCDSYDSAFESFPLFVNIKCCSVFSKRRCKQRSWHHLVFNSCTTIVNNIISTCDLDSELD
ncbi:hypothetical protein CEXT_791201 [Caerostris extrusa]|uniref:Uncharacterized protein n=1 Tax=Caerostris extrusa TaxID=172846 RepID=A0AAV4VMV6_CAEEX|nr:hypothetical protein CEXT_791201 [Caerostris extrusa]